MILFENIFIYFEFFLRVGGTILKLNGTNKWKTSKQVRGNN